MTDSRTRMPPRLRRHDELIARIGHAMSCGWVDDWHRKHYRMGWRWMIQTTEGPWCLSFRRAGMITTRQAEQVVEKIIDAGEAAARR